ncbi:hypothetical protein RchiOBHm_Chr3g0447451 [Rosa chinensis]|uniref:Uncharacterized protein n=1 Tax=Rosa chinensis TaxID=74649 RepID=A0A2P6R4X8_ROSCH|nr:hypothetical protein RchiOBHm_Chr3g0447451 [Rosa chinensis]
MKGNFILLLPGLRYGIVVLEIRKYALIGLDFSGGGFGCRLVSKATLHQQMNQTTVFHCRLIRHVAVVYLNVV